MTAILLTLAAIQATEGVTKVTAPKDAVAVVAADLAATDEHDRPYQRYIWLPPWIETNSAARATVFAVNTTSRASILVQPVIATDVYIRYDLRQLVDDHDDDLARFTRVWDEVSLLDSRFYAAVEILIGVDVVRQHGKSFFSCPRCGKRYQTTKTSGLCKCSQCATRFRIPGDHNPKAGHGRQLAPHLGLDQIGGLVLLSGIATPIVSADVFVTYALSAIDGGRYYDLVGISGLNKRQWLATLGANQKLSENLLALRRSAITSSGVMGDKPRVVERIQGAVGDAYGTYDIADDSDRLDLDKHVFYNLAGFVGNHDAEEWIAERQNGLHVFALFDATGVLQTEVPPEIALAHNRPGPRSLPRGGGAGTKRLNIIDCTLCHASADGWQPFANEVADNKRLDVFDDFNGRDRHEILRVLASQYRGDLDKQLADARDDYSLAVFSLVEDFGVTPKDRPVQIVGSDIGDIYNDYYWDRVDPQRAAFELGYDCADNDTATRLLVELVSDDTPVEGISFESYAIGRLKEGKSVRRRDFDRELPEILFRAEQNKEEVEK